mmetsp:Transcript_12032/g.22492  ORF Transcript_12032/g.22492 Transcript_12032/m.22492 type:complete len:275 (-) Transcript_12032:91-915(-)
MCHLLICADSQHGVVHRRFNNHLTRSKSMNHPVHWIVCIRVGRCIAVLSEACSMLHFVTREGPGVQLWWSEQVGERIAQHTNKPLFLVFSILWQTLSLDQLTARQNTKNLRLFLIANAKWTFRNVVWLRMSHLLFCCSVAICVLPWLLAGFLRIDHVTNPAFGECILAQKSHGGSTCKLACSVKAPPVFGLVIWSVTERWRSRVSWSIWSTGPKCICWHWISWRKRQRPPRTASAQWCAVLTPYHCPLNSSSGSCTPLLLCLEQLLKLCQLLIT